MVGQMRDAIHRQIQFNPSTVSYFKNNSLIVETIKIAHESGSVPANKSIPVGLGTSFSLYAVMEYNSQISENDILIHGGVGYRCNAIDAHKIEGQVYSKRCVLNKIDLLISTKAITSFKIGLASGVISGTNITITLPIGTDITSLTPTIVHNGQMISPVGVQDFTNPVSYTVTAQNLTTQTYTITVVLS